ncbi:MAG: hypothetical protein M5U28_51970 [Sandaracinaceae bacterium]|nr:hypothetical protein [Sandaracinaceae bacterium]
MVPVRCRPVMTRGRRERRPGDARIARHGALDAQPVGEDADEALARDEPPDRVEARLAGDGA